MTNQEPSQTVGQEKPRREAEMGYTSSHEKLGLALSEALSNGAIVSADIHVEQNFDEASLTLRSEGQTVEIWIDDRGHMEVHVDKTMGVRIGDEYYEYARDRELT
jgi:anti-sigma regulatory factor (Ser/Thr protein kinase)